MSTNFPADNPEERFASAERTVFRPPTKRGSSGPKEKFSRKKKTRRRQKKLKKEDGKR